MEIRAAEIIILSTISCYLFGCSDFPSSHNKLNDTGISWGGNYPKDINKDCSGIVNRDQLFTGDQVAGDILPQQDCNYGRDVTTNDGSDGAHGFVYRKIDQAGQPLSADADNWQCVLDEISGLLWEAKQGGDGVYGNQGLHDADDVFTWYNTDIRTNGGNIGDWNNKYQQCAGYAEDRPETYCNSGEYVSRVNTQGWCGFTDWRMPTQAELASLVHFGRTVPAIDINYFPNTQNEFYWTNTPTAGIKTTAWAINFRFGYSASVRHSNSRSVRLVRNWNTDTQSH